MKRIKKILVMLCISMCVAVAMPTVLPSATSIYTVKAASKVKINKKSASITKGNKVQLKVTETSKKISWKSSNTKVATVSSKGLVKGIKQGSATITATVGKKKYTCKVTVKAAKTTGTKVWIPQTGSKYHRSSSCSNMKNPSKVKQSDAEDWGYTPCKRCY